MRPTSRLTIALAIAAGAAALAAPATAGWLPPGAAASHSSSTVEVRYRWRDGYYYPRSRSRYWVDAPFAYVEGGSWRGRSRVAVDAPFASVRVGRRGTWVRAPFVDLYVPR